MTEQALRRYLPHASVAALVLCAVLFANVTVDALRSGASTFLRLFDWLVLATATGAVLLCAALVVLPVGQRRIGGHDARPEFRTVTWLAMLFAAGMGTGLVFWGAAEPLIHTTNPVPSSGLAPLSDPARAAALAQTLFHWALHAWAIYAVAALAVAVFQGRGRAPLPSTPFPTLRPSRARWIDWLALIAVIFGVVATLATGSLQLSAGAARLLPWGLGDGVALRLLMLGLLTAAFLLSAAAGLRRGIAILSNINMGLALVLAGFVFVAGPTAVIVQTLADSLAAYGASFVRLSTELRPPGEGRDWTRAWSLTYFLWWIAWTPFIGVFVARISHGRRIRTFLAGVVLVPSVVTLLWFSIFGGTAMWMEVQGVGLGIEGQDTAQEAAYAMLDNLPFPGASQLLTVVLLFIFLLTSADSGAYVLAMFSAGTSDPPVGERLFWGSVLAILTAAALIGAVGYSAISAFAVAGAVPLLFLLIAQGGALAVSTVRWRRGRT